MALEKTVEREEQLFQFSASHVLCVLEGEIKKGSLFPFCGIRNDKLISKK
jgi:hypothetical protein